MSYFAFPIGINIFAVWDGKLLLGRRKGAYGAGEWGLPGGHLEQGETMVLAAARELAEETSLTASGFAFANLTNDNNSIEHYIEVGFVAEGLAGEVALMEPDKCSEWRWFPLDALPPDIFSGHRAQIASFRKGVPFVDEKSV